jgi:RHS repeat-associated protein
MDTLRNLGWLVAGCTAAALACSRDSSGRSGWFSGRSRLTVSVTTNQLGRLTSVGGGPVRTYLQYDTLGRPVVSEHVLEGTSYVYRTQYGYPQTTLNLCNANVCGAGAPGSEVVASVFPDGELTTFSYDAGGAQQAVTTTPCLDNQRGTSATCTIRGAAQPLVLQVLRNVRGQTTQVNTGDGAISTHVYGEATDLRLQQIETVAGAVVVQAYNYQFDPSGNVIRVDDFCSPQGVCCDPSGASCLPQSLSAAYGYDSIDQLTSMTSNGVTYAYAYDSIGNLKLKEGVNQGYGGPGAGPHALTSAGGLSYQYDANGNLLSRSDGLSVVSDARNMPAQVAGGAATTTTQKFYLNESLWKKVQGATTTYYLPGLRMENGVPRKELPGSVERDLDGSLKFYHGDHLGSSTLVLDASGAPVHRAAYMPFGADRPVSSGSFTPKYQFSFKEKEQDGTGFYDFGARLLDPVSGRWLAPDTVVSDGPNRYAYVRNNPLRYTDPTGHETVCDDEFRDRVSSEETETVLAIEQHAKQAGGSDPEPLVVFAAGMLSGGPDSSYVLSQSFSAFVVDQSKDASVRTQPQEVHVLNNNNGYVQAGLQVGSGTQLKALVRILKVANENHVPLILGCHSNGCITLSKALSQVHGAGGVVKELFVIAPALDARHIVSLSDRAAAAGVKKIYMYSADNDHALRLGLFTLDSRKGMSEAKAKHRDLVEAFSTHNQRSPRLDKDPKATHQNGDLHHLYDYLDAMQTNHFKPL